MTDISQRINALLCLEEQRNHALEKMRKRKQSIKKYFDKKSKSVVFEVDEKVLLWDFGNTNKGKNSKFHKICLGPYKTVSIICNNLYLLKDIEGWLFSYTTKQFIFKELC
jgi:hypothetical protein